MSSYYLRGPSLDAILLAVQAAFEADGYAPAIATRVPALKVFDRNVRAALVVARNGWISVQEWGSGAPWGELLSGAQHAPVLHLADADADAREAVVRLYERGALVAERPLLQDATREADGRLRLHLPRTMQEDSPAVSTGFTGAIPALLRALGIEDAGKWPAEGAAVPAEGRLLVGTCRVPQPARTWENSVGDAMVSYLHRASTSSERAPRRPWLPEWEDGHRLASDLRLYAERAVAVGWVDFCAPWSEIGSQLRESVAALWQMLAPLDEMTIVRHSGEAMTSSGLSWAVVDTELQQSSAARWQHDGAGLLLISRPDGGPPGLGPARADGRFFDLPRLSIGWHVRRDRADDQFPQTSRRVLEAALGLESTLGGYVTAAGAPPDEHGWETSYTRLLGHTLTLATQSWLATHARAPGWCVAVPTAAATFLELPCPRVRSAAHPFGTLVQSRAESPFRYDDADAEAMEACVACALGSSAELDVRA